MCRAGFSDILTGEKSLEFFNLIYTIVFEGFISNGKSDRNGWGYGNFPLCMPYIRMASLSAVNLRSISIGGECQRRSEDSKFRESWGN